MRISERGLRIGGVVMFFVAAPTAAAPLHFDLVCHSRSHTTAANIEPLDEIDDSRMSVDLERRLWCWHKGPACAQALPVAAAGEPVLKLGSVVGPQGDSRIEVDLSSGAYTSLIHVRVGGTPEITSSAAGHCTMAPFTSGIL